jgi:hypothetical protein
MRRAIAVLILLLVSTSLVAQSSPTFDYVVTAVTSAGLESAFSNQVTATFTQGQHIVNLSWTASTSTVSGYNIYRGTVSGGPYVKINTALVTSVTYADTFVLPNAPTGLAATEQ